MSRLFSLEQDICNLHCILGRWVDRSRARLEIARFLVRNRSSPAHSSGDPASVICLFEADNRCCLLRHHKELALCSAKKDKDSFAVTIV